MRRLLIIFTLLCIANTMCAQRTYYYKCEKMVDVDGSMRKGNGTLYLTFTGNIMYESNADGTKKDGMFYPTFNYRGEVKGCWWYCSKQIIYTGYGIYRRAVESWRENYYYLVSKDYNTINCVLGGTTYVYQRCTPEDNVPGLIR